MKNEIIFILALAGLYQAANQANTLAAKEVFTESQVSGDLSCEDIFAC